MMQHQRMLSDLLIETCDELNRRADSRRISYHGATNSAFCDGVRNRRSGRELTEGQDETRLALSGHLDRLRLFPHILWKSCTTLGSLSRRFDECGEKIKQFSVEKLRRNTESLTGSRRWLVGEDLAVADVN